jgi:cytoskeletal protein RodZ
MNNSHTMNSPTNMFLIIVVSLGIVLLLFAGVYYLFMNDTTDTPSQVSSSVQQNSQTSEPAGEVTGLVVSEENSSITLSADQQAALVALGIDPAAVPSSVTPAQQACLVDTLGEEKFLEIKSGAVPSGFDFLKAKACF